MGSGRRPAGVTVNLRYNRVEYVADTDDDSVQSIEDGRFGLASIGERGSYAGSFTGPSGLAFDVSNNLLLVTDAGNDRIEAFTPSTSLAKPSFVTQWGSTGNGLGQFRGPQGLACDRSANIYVADTENDRIQKFGGGVTRTTPSTWGRIKALYR